MNLFLQTFGCKVNATETDSIGALLMQNNWQIVSEPEQADAIIINSCTVTASGDKRMLQAIRKLRKKAPNAVLLLTGCYVQAFPEQAKLLPEIDIIIGTKNRNVIPVLLENYIKNHAYINAVEAFQTGDSFESLPQGTDSMHTRAFLKIQDGCNRFCSYCIIPYARGRCRSRELSEITAETKKLVQQGYQEIVLCGINLACYGLENNLTIADAVQAVADTGIPRIRLSSLEPDGLTQTVLEKLSNIPELLPHFHISVQTGCDKILKAMRRHYTCEEYANLLKIIRKLFPDCAITTDIMTGFPSETEKDFLETLKFTEKMAFSEIHIFRYSPRPGTPASEMTEQVPENIKKSRADRLCVLAKKLHENYLLSCIGKKYQVLFERQKSSEFHNGHAENYITVLVPAKSDENLRGQVLAVKIKSIQDNKLIGELC
ncbi:MAG: tRNA (N(6)-L-threonylcarbamoyladenosine(37)-C(2))-methylthiotransferase MtaB [Oscillospiraceae bacterium]|nr:tRNA (N(6)-L-threonylcarbamoyladenosine(37)-C(2))-methylthiotransferase MtaB [Ruminococcus sp.]MDE6706828.1 tRNA (N(6)-L-threonylcarbamoyladenosine(37)-C(2))-methylthiotransferase MtaB [Oscillospiraceae bacterium]